MKVLFPILNMTWNSTLMKSRAISPAFSPPCHFLLMRAAEEYTTVEKNIRRDALGE